MVKRIDPPLWIAILATQLEEKTISSWMSIVDAITFDVVYMGERKARKKWEKIERGVMP